MKTASQHSSNNAEQDRLNSQLNQVPIEAEPQLEPLENFYQFFNTIFDFLFILDMLGNIIYVNKTVIDRLGYTLDELIGQSVLRVHPEHRREEANQYVGEMLQNKRLFCPVPLVTKQGQQVPVETRVTLGTWSGQPVLFGVSKDISELKLSEEKFSKAFQFSAAVMAISRIVSGQYIDVNQSFCEKYGYTREEALGHSAKELDLFVNYQDRIDLLNQLENVTRVRDKEIKVRKKDGTLLIGLINAEFIYIGQEKCLMTTLLDITQIKRMESEIRAHNFELEKLVTQKIGEIEEAELVLKRIESEKQEELLFSNLHDPLTGLKNRNALRIFKSNVEAQAVTIQPHSVICLNLDNFRVINEDLGHHAGDQFITEIADKLFAISKPLGTVYRNEGDEFVILVESIDLTIIQKMAKKILAVISEKLIINGRMYTITASIGMCLGSPLETIFQTIKHADTALYVAKKVKNTTVLYSRDMEKARSREIVLEDDLRRAIDENQLELHFQPIYNVKTKMFDQAEALLRWNHPTLGRISPVEFIPIAEKTKLILPITDWVIREACQKIAAWNANGLQGIMVSVNLSFISFEHRSDELVQYIEKTIKEAEISPKSLKLEITESTLMHDTEDVMLAFQALKKIGVRLALDDFGTGYSTFGYLKDLPLDIVKIDRSLIANIASNAKDQMILGSLIAIIQGLALEVVVEGVETKAQLDLLMQFGCDYIQGFYFSRPLPTSEFLAFLLHSQHHFATALV
ncbi:MAG: EAL domain-containing protein [Eubacteriales bacterium]|nr:EAL domain-containing protein [Eubacteriales bacterium]